MQSLHRRLRTHGDHLSSWTSLLRNIYRWAFSSPRNISPVLKPRQGVHQITFAVTEVVNIPQRSSKPQENGVAERMNKQVLGGCSTTCCPYYKPSPYEVARIKVYPLRGLHREQALGRPPTSLRMHGTCAYPSDTRRIKVRTYVFIEPVGELSSLAMSSSMRGLGRTSTESR